MMDIITAENNDYPAVRALWDSCFMEDSIKWRNWYFANRYKPNNANLLYVNNNLVSMVHMNPYILILNNKYIKSAAMAGVATDISMRNKSYAKALIEYSIKKAYTDGYEYSFLHPFNYDFYEKYGYRCAYYIYTYKIQYKSIKETSYPIVISEYKQDDIDTIYNIYKKATQKYNGYINRDACYFKEYLNSFLIDECKVYILKIHHDIGYYIYDTINERIEEFFFTGNLAKAYANLCSYLQKDIIIKNQPFVDITHTEIVSDQKRHCMIRVLNFQSLMKKFKFLDSSIYINIKDSIIDENNNSFYIEAKNGITNIHTVENKEYKKYSINEISIIIAGASNVPVTLNEFFSIAEIKNSSFIVEEL